MTQLQLQLRQKKQTKKQLEPIAKFSIIRKHYVYILSYAHFGGGASFTKFFF